MNDAVVSEINNLNQRLEEYAKKMETDVVSSVMAFHRRRAIGICVSLLIWAGSMAGVFYLIYRLFQSGFVAGLACLLLGSVSLEFLIIIFRTRNVMVMQPTLLPEGANIITDIETAEPLIRNGRLLAYKEVMCDKLRAPGTTENPAPPFCAGHFLMTEKDGEIKCIFLDAVGVEVVENNEPEIHFARKGGRLSLITVPHGYWDRILSDTKGESS